MWGAPALRRKVYECCWLKTSNSAQIIQDGPLTLSCFVLLALHVKKYTSTLQEFTSNAHTSKNRQSFISQTRLRKVADKRGALVHSPFDAVKSIATVKLIWVLQEEIYHVRKNVEPSIMLDYSVAWFKASRGESFSRRLSVLISELRDKHGRLSSQQRLHTGAIHRPGTRPRRYLPPSYVVQEGELSVHQAGEEGDLSIKVGTL